MCVNKLEMSHFNFRPSPMSNGNDIIGRFHAQANNSINKNETDKLTDNIQEMHISIIFNVYFCTFHYAKQINQLMFACHFINSVCSIYAPNCCSQSSYCISSCRKTSSKTNEVYFCSTVIQQLNNQVICSSYLISFCNIVRIYRCRTTRFLLEILHCHFQKSSGYPHQIFLLPCSKPHQVV